MPNNDLLFHIDARIDESGAALSAGIPVEPMRLFNGRGSRIDGFDDINIDIYPPLIYVTLFGEYSDQKLADLSDMLEARFSGCPQLIQDRSLRPAVVRLERGDIPDELIITENGLRYLINPKRGQNPGFFIDMREGRLWVSEMIGSRRGADIGVLNLFSYTCAFSVVAALAGASKIVNIDMNGRSLQIGRRNHSLNPPQAGPGSKTVFLPHDIFKSTGRLKKEGPYDLIIADPPPTQKGSFGFKKDYPRLLRKLPQMLRPSGLLFLTHNGRGDGWNEFEDLVMPNLPDFEIISRLDPPFDFAPAELGHGLKILILRKKAEA